MTEITLDDWAAAVSAELGIEVEFDVGQVLDLARIAAHNVTRPAAPLTTFLAGFAAGRAGGSAGDVTAAIDAASVFCDRAGDAREEDVH